MPAEKKAAFAALGFGDAIKICYRFQSPFWEEGSIDGQSLADALYFFSEEEIPTWWTQHPAGDNLLVGWSAGPKASALSTESSETIIEKGLHSLSVIFNKPMEDLRTLLLSAYWYNWKADPYIMGSYSYQVVNGSRLIDECLTPLNSKIYFAGEGFCKGPQIGTVEAALVSGKNAAAAIFKNKLQGT